MCSCAVGFFELCSCIRWRLEIGPWETTPTTPPPRIHRTLPITALLEIGLRNHSNYPPSNSPNVTDNPPLGNRPEKPTQLPPPSNSANVTDNPPPLGNRPEKPLQLPPPPRRIHRTLPTTPLLEIGLRNHSNYPPPSNSSNFTDYPPSKYLPRGICVLGKNP